MHEWCPPYRDLTVLPYYVFGYTKRYWAGLKKYTTSLLSTVIMVFKFTAKDTKKTWVRRSDKTSAREKSYWEFWGVFGSFIVKQKNVPTL